MSQKQIKKARKLLKQVFIDNKTEVPEKKVMRELEKRLKQHG